MPACAEATSAVIDVQPPFNFAEDAKWAVLGSDSFGMNVDPTSGPEGVSAFAVKVAVGGESYRHNTIQQVANRLVRLASDPKAAVVMSREYPFAIEER